MTHICTLYYILHICTLYYILHICTLQDIHTTHIHTVQICTLTRCIAYMHIKKIYNIYAHFNIYDTCAHFKIYIYNAHTYIIYTPHWQHMWHICPLYESTYICMYALHVHVCICTCVRVCMYVCMYVNIYDTYTHFITHIHILRICPLRHIQLICPLRHILHVWPLQHIHKTHMHADNIHCVTVTYVLITAQATFVREKTTYLSLRKPHLCAKRQEMNLEHWSFTITHPHKTLFRSSGYTHWIWSIDPLKKL
jgi:hypothetical protein